MATVYRYLEAAEFDVGTSNIPELIVTAGTNFPVPGYSFDAGADEAIYKRFAAYLYGSGNITVDLDWYAASATSNNCMWGAAIAAITPSTDSQSILTDSFATENTQTGTASASAGRVFRTTITVNNLDSIAAGDSVELRIRRVGTNGSDTMTGDAVLVGVGISYSDT